MADDDETVDGEVYAALARLCEGKKETDVVAVLNAIMVSHRVTRRDGKPGIGTRDHRLDRLNLTIVGDTVTEVRRG
jgi:hypothetical protein